MKQPAARFDDRLSSLLDVLVDELLERVASQPPVVLDAQDKDSE